MTNTTAALEAQVPALKSEITQILEAFARVAAKEELPAELKNAGRVATKRGYFRWSTQAGRYMLTDEGKKFYRAMKRFAPRVRKLMR